MHKTAAIEASTLLLNTHTKRGCVNIDSSFLIPAAGADISAFVPAGGCTDAAGNGNLEGTKLTVRTDTTKPAVVVTAKDSTGKVLVVR